MFDLGDFFRNITVAYNETCPLGGGVASVCT